MTWKTQSWGSGRSKSRGVRCFQFISKNSLHIHVPNKLRVSYKVPFLPGAAESGSHGPSPAYLPKVSSHSTSSSMVRSRSSKEGLPSGFYD